MNATATAAESGTQLGDSDVDLLVTYLTEEEEIQQQLYEKLREKERHLVGQDMDALEACLRSTEPILGRLEVCTHRRVRILRSMGGRLGLAPDRIQVSTLVERCPEGRRRSLEEARVRLRGVLVRIGTQNRRNQVLIRNGIELNESLVLALFGNGAARQTYDRSARAHSVKPAASCLDQEL